LLADEINRATPKTQSALLEVMEEAQVTIDAVTYTLPQPFFVIATQNPSSQIGTFALPESQLDRFLMRITLHYPDAASERKLLQSNGGRERLAKLTAVIDSKQLQALQTACQEVHVSDALLDYLQAILQYTRQSQQFNHGLSPRAGLSLKQCAQAWAMLEGRDHVIPEDIQAILPSVAGHRLVSNTHLSNSAENIAQLLKAVAV
jgi:MoxR-like ATPase